MDHAEKQGRSYCMSHGLDQKFVASNANSFFLPHDTTGLPSRTERSFDVLPLQTPSRHHGEYWLVRRDHQRLTRPDKIPLSRACEDRSRTRPDNAKRDWACRMLRPRAKISDGFRRISTDYFDNMPANSRVRTHFTAHCHKARRK